MGLVASAEVGLPSWSLVSVGGWVGGDVLAICWGLDYRLVGRSHDGTSRMP